MSELNGFVMEAFPVEQNDGTIDLVRRPEWRLFASQDGFGVELRAAGMVIAFPVERAVAGRLMHFFTNDEYTLLPDAKETPRDE